MQKLVFGLAARARPKIEGQNQDDAIAQGGKQVLDGGIGCDGIAHHFQGRHRAKAADDENRLQKAEQKTAPPSRNCSSKCLA